MRKLMNLVILTIVIFAVGCKSTTKTPSPIDESPSRGFRIARTAQ